MPDLNYDAFISYRRSDGAQVAGWLRNQLQGFRVPKGLRAKYERKLRVYMDAAYERGTTDFYALNIKPALLSSRFLIVVATPDAIRRANELEDWIHREVHDFTEGVGATNLIVVRGAGPFDGPLPSNLMELFPHIEIVDLRGANRFAFLNFSRAARLASEKLKVLAPLLGIPAEEMPRLRQEEERRQQTRLGIILGAALGTIVAVIGLSALALVSRNQAIWAHDDSMFAASSMAEQAAYLASSDPATARTRRLIINRGCDLLDKAEQGTISDPPISGFVLCRVERALQHEELGETEEARTQLNQGIEHARLQHQRLSRMDAALALLKAEQAYGEFLLRQKDISSAETAYAEMVNDAKLLDREHDRPAQIMRYEGEALGRIGDQQSARGDFSKAATSYDDAATSVTNWVNAATSEQRKPNPQAIAWVMRLHRLAAQRHMDLNDVEGARERFQRSLSASQLLGEPAESSRSLQIEIAYADAGIFRLETAAGNAVAAENAKQSALSTLDAILQSKNSTPNLKSRARELKQSFQP